MTSFRPSHPSSTRTRVRVERGRSTRYRAVAPPLLGFVQSAPTDCEKPDVVHLSYGALGALRGLEYSDVTTLCGQRLADGTARSPEQPSAPPCPMCLDMAMNDTASGRPLAD